MIAPDRIEITLVITPDRIEAHCADSHVELISDDDADSGDLTFLRQLGEYFVERADTRDCASVSPLR